MPSLYNPSLTSYRTPSLTAFNRLIPFPVSIDYEQNLRAEVQDPLWFLARQWQMGEFVGEDAGAPAFARVLSSQAEPKRLQFLQSNLAEPYDYRNMPLEVAVEREAVFVTVHMRVQAGFYFQKILDNNSLLQHLPKFIERCPLPTTDLLEWDEQGQLLLASARGKIADGVLLCTDNTIPNWVQSTFAANGAVASLLSAVDELRKWLLRNYPMLATKTDGVRPKGWKMEQFEYSIALQAIDQATQKTVGVKSEHYADGQLDWSDFSWFGEGIIPNAVKKAESFIPKPVKYSGMPNQRFWEMEEGRVNFGTISMSPANVLSMAFAEFGLTYSNDWFWVPLPLKVNTLCKVDSLEVTNVFGEKFSYQLTPDNSSDPLSRFTLFQLSGDNNTSQSIFYLPPTLTKIQEAAPLERVYFLRDEQSNLAWAVEAIIPSANQQGISLNLNNTIIPQTVQTGVLRYRLGNMVPENWTPFLPVRINLNNNQPSTTNNSQTRLQRARMPGGQPPRGQVLQDIAVGKQYLIREEEVSRAGTVIERSWQRTRWLNGKTHTWIGRRKTAGSIENTNGLTWDWVVRE